MRVGLVMRPDQNVAMTRVRKVARILDSALRIPGTNIRFGLDAVIGLVPGLGDAAGAVLAAYVILLAARLGAPTAVIVRMLANVAIDAAVGAIPLVGDAFDVVWKANARNVDLLDRYLDAPAKVHAASRAVLAGIVIALVALVGGVIALGVLAIKFLLTWPR